MVQAKSRARVLSLTGNVEFQDKAAALNLHASTIAGLGVDPDGVVGVFTGTATLNGTAGYGFAAWVEDKAEPGARVDTFRIQIYYAIYYAGLLIYDNGGVLNQGGNIQVQRTN